jgi:hypothetical protein
MCEVRRESLQSCSQVAKLGRERTKGRVGVSRCSSGVTVIVLPVRELSKNKRVITNAEFALMSSGRTCGGDMTAVLQ